MFFPKDIAKRIKPAAKHFCDFEFVFAVKALLKDPGNNVSANKKSESALEDPGINGFEHRGIIESQAKGVPLG